MVDEAGVVSVIKGDASASPISPSVDESHILVQYILVEAGTTEPAIVQEDIYLENAEWTTSTYTTGTATGSIDFDNAVSPKQRTFSSGEEWVELLEESRQTDIDHTQLIRDYLKKKHGF